MKIRVLGSDGGISPGKKTTSFLINDKILIDAGAAASALSISKQEELDAIFISHPHIDHIKDIPFIADNIIGFRKKPIDLISTTEILKDVEKHLFNNVLWPDMTRLPPKAPVLKYKAIKEKITINGLTIKMYKVNHPGNAVGFIISDKKSTVVITGDTGPTDLLWKKANLEKNLKAVLTEIAFPCNQEAIANVSGHFTPKTLKDEISKLKKKVPIYIYHFKPRFYEVLFKEVQELNLDYLQIINEEDEFTF